MSASRRLTIKRWWGPKRPASAWRSSGSFLRSLPRARSASDAGSVVPAASAISIERPDTPSASVATLESLMPASCNTLWSRLAARLRSSVKLLRYRVRSRSSRIGAGWTKAAAQEPVLEQLCQPRTVGHVGLAPRDLFELGGVDQEQLEVVLQHVVDRFPVDPGRIHCHVGHPLLAQPVAQCQQFTGGGGESADLLFNLAAGPLCHSHARADRGFVHIQSAAAFDQPFHILASLRHRRAEAS